MTNDSPFWVRTYTSNNVFISYPAKFLQINGQYVKNTTYSLNSEGTLVGDSQIANIYATDSPDATAVKDANPNNYYVVPANFDIDAFLKTAQSVKAAGEIAGNIVVQNRLSYLVALSMLGDNFLPGAPGDIQKFYTDQNFVPAFTSVASYLFGYYAQKAGIGLDISLGGAGVLNAYEAIKSSKVITDSIYDNPLKNVLNIIQGALAADDTGGVSIMDNSFAKSVSAELLLNETKYGAAEAMRTLILELLDPTGLVAVTGGGTLSLLSNVGDFAITGSSYLKGVTTQVLKMIGYGGTSAAGSGGGSGQNPAGIIVINPQAGDDFGDSSGGNDGGTSDSGGGSGSGSGDGGTSSSGDGGSNSGGDGSTGGKRGACTVC